MFAQIQARAAAFTWDMQMQQAANVWASAALAGQSEDLRKGLAGLITNDIGQLLSARFASSWGLQRIMQVQRGVLLASGHDFYTAIGEAVGWDSEWVRLRRITFALAHTDGATPTLREQVEAGLLLYCETARLLEGTLQPIDEPLITHTVALIQEARTMQPELQLLRLG